MSNNFDDRTDRLTSETTGNGIYYFIGALVLIFAIIGFGTFAYGPPREELANAPPARIERTLPAPVAPTPTVPAAPGAVPLAPRE